MRAPDVYLTVDVEPDCPPYLWTWRGIEEGLPPLLALFAAEGVAGTFFVTGATAERFPDAVAAIATARHEIGCHGFSHRSFADLSEEEARDEIARTNRLLRTFAAVTSFRAPYLAFPERFLPLLAEQDIRTDASLARYKLKERPSNTAPGIRRLSASVPPSFLRLPSWLRDPCLGLLKTPLVLFVHPWEFVDFRRAPIPWDCAFRTGAPALDDLRAVIRLLRKAGACFRRVEDYAN